MQFCMSFNDAIRQFHATIGCEAVGCKPKLLYKLPRMGTQPIELATEADWEGLKQHVCMLKDAMVTGTIVINPEVFMFFFHSLCHNILTAFTVHENPVGPSQEEVI